MVSFKYSVPRRDGSFVMPPGFVSRRAFLAKFSYVKMIAVCITIISLINVIATGRATMTGTVVIHVIQIALCIPVLSGKAVLGILA